MTVTGRIVRISGAVVEAECAGAVALGEVAEVGTQGLLGEVIALRGQIATAQVYEETEGLAPGDPFRATGAPLTVELGPGRDRGGRQAPCEARRGDSRGGLAG